MPDQDGPGGAGGVGFYVATEFEANAVRRGIAASRLAADAQVVQCGIACRDLDVPASVAEFGAVISCGFAAGLRADVPTSAVLIPRLVYDESGTSLPVDSDWHARIVDSIDSRVQPVTDPLIQVSEVVATPASKSALSDDGRFAGADMESAFLAAACRDHDVPFLVLRVVLDDRDTVVPDAISRMAASTTASTVLPVLGSMLTETAATRHFVARSFAARRALVDLLGLL